MAWLNKKGAIDNELLLLVKRLKEKEGLIIYDTHAHPLDIIGIIDPQDYIERDNLLVLDKTDLDSKVYKDNIRYPTIPEYLKYGVISNLLFRGSFYLLPSVVKDSIKKSYSLTGTPRLAEEMKLAEIDKTVLLPVEPWVSAKQIYKYFNHERFILLGSIDIHNMLLERIEEFIDYQIRNFNIKGIKLHPNLQGFLPQPSHNKPEIAEKLSKLYEVVANKGLYILFHGGVSGLIKFKPKTTSSKEKYLKVVLKRRSNNALLENYCDSRGESEIFGNYDIPIVLAHMGSYALIRPNFKLLKTVAKRYNNVFFDTAGVSPRLIRKVLEIIGSKKVLFGSDALYNRMLYNFKFCLEAVKKANIDETLEKCLLNILGRNFQTKIEK